jgi:hypothetical protein
MKLQSPRIAAAKFAVIVPPTTSFRHTAAAECGYGP